MQCHAAPAGFQPFPFSSAAIQAASQAVAAFNKGMALHQGWTMMPFTVPFNNGTADTTMPGFLVTPDPSKALPVVLYTGGTDGPKEVGPQRLHSYGCWHATCYA